MFLNECSMWHPSYIKGFIALWAIIQPFSRTTILVDADAAWHYFFGRVVRKYDSKVANFSDYRIVLIAAALPISMRMDMHISHNHQFFVTAPLPYFSELSAIKFHDSVSKTVRGQCLHKKGTFRPDEYDHSCTRVEMRHFHDSRRFVDGVRQHRFARPDVGKPV